MYVRYYLLKIKYKIMKIVHVTWMFTFGGIETMLVNICNEQIKLGHDVHLIVMEDSTVEARSMTVLTSE